MAPNILLVDDDALMRRSLAFSLEQNGFHAFSAATAEDAIMIARRDIPDLVLLDIGLPGMDGLAAVSQLRDQLGIPVIFLTARRRELDEVLGLELGADDYITKPFDTDVLLAHIKAVLRRSNREKEKPQGPQPMVIGDLKIDPPAHVVLLNGLPVDLTPREFDLLYTLASEVGHVVTVDALLSRVWGAEFLGQPQVVYVHVRWLREKLEEEPEHPKRIMTVRGVGYKLMANTDEAQVA